MKLFLIICFSIPIFMYGQIDTVKIKGLIPQTNELYAHKDFWRRIEYRDQELRKSPNIETIDEENLLCVIYYYNKFGYPDIHRLGDHAKIVQGVWGHNRYSKISQYTFPLIFAGFKEGDISEPAYREFYLRYLYQFKFEGKAYKTSPIDSLHLVLDLKERDKLSVDTVLAFLSEYKQIRRDTNHILGRWLAVNPADTFYYEGKPLVKKEERHKVILYVSSNSKYYLSQESFANAVEPTEVVPLNLEKTRFAVAGKETSKYYLITEDKGLQYTDDSRVVFKSYVACR